ncbi:MAG: hypothetical protein JO182_31270 [Acidobacteriaceae bacterium]|nr:hypothetical protein [Acidobacteriaceae bacterium]MBV9305181.1 hypothetical protein [Acidobacteriaceae bacterium]
MHSVFRKTVTLRLNVDITVRRGLQGSNEVGTGTIVTRQFVVGFGELLNPLLDRQALSGGFRFERRGLFIG